jgi:phospholipid/cholesterol/gamma-HCH transport system substrate-binding protein
MVKQKPSKILIGLFVIVGSAICVGTIIWLGASRYFEKGSPYIAYFDESVQGLNPDSRVKLRGVNIGRVKDINVDPTNAKVEVIMTLDPEEPLGKNVCAELKSVGLTGIMFIDLDLINEMEVLEPPPKNARPAYPVIPTRPSQTKQIMSGIDTAIQKINSIRTEAIIHNLESATARLDKALQHVDRLFTDGRVDHIVDDTKNVISEARNTLRSIRTEIEGLKLKETSEQTRGLLGELRQDSRKISTDLKKTGENLRDSSEHLKTLVEKLEANPSEILFPSKPSPRIRKERP